MPQLIDTEGRLRDVEEKDVANALSQGWHPETEADVSRRAGAAASQTDYGGARGVIGAVGAGLARGATLGLSDVAARMIGGDDAAQTLEGLRTENPYTSAAGEIAGTLAPSLITGGAATPAGVASRVGRAVAAEGEGAGLVGRTIASAAGAGAEGALYGGGQYLSQVALENKPLSAEGFVAGMGNGALFAAPIGGALTLSEAALIRAKSLFPRAQVTPEAAAAVKQDAISSLQSSLADGEQMAATARKQIALNEAQAGSGAAKEQLTRRVFGGADPVALGDQAAVGAQNAQLREALGRLETSQQALKEWVATEADPELEQALAGLQSPAVTSRAQSFADAIGEPDLGALAPNGGGLDFGIPAPVVRGPQFEPGIDRTLEHLAPSSRPGSVPVGEFGAPGARGIKSADELERAAAAAGTEGPAVAAESPAARAPTEPRTTRVLRGGAQEPPASSPDVTAAGRPGATGRSGKATAAPAGFDLEGSTEAGRVFNERPTVTTGVPDLGAISRETFRDRAYVVRPSELLDRDVLGIKGGNDMLADARTRGVGDAWKRGQAVPPLEIDVDPDGHYFVADGNHRLLAAALDGDRPVVARFRPVESDLSGEDRIGDDIGRALSKNSPETHQSDALIAELRTTNPKVADAIEEYQPKAIKQKVAFKQCADGLCDAIEPEFQVYASGAGLRRHRFDLNSEDGLRDIQQAYNLSDEQLSALKAENGRRIRELGADAKDMFHQISVTKDGIAIDWTANQFKPLPVPYVFRMPKATAAGAEPDLEALLRGTKAALDRGEHFTAVGRPVAAEYRAAKAVKTAENATHFRAKANAENYARSDMAAAEAAARRAAPDLDALAPTRSPATRVGRRPAAVETVAPPADAAAAPAAAKPGTLEDLGALLGMTSKHGTVASAEDFERLFGIHPNEFPDIAKTIVDREIRARMGAAADDAAIERALAKHNGKNKNIAADLGKAAKAIGDHEAASADVAELLGEHAPATAVQRAQAYRAALAGQADAAGASAARSAQDINNKVVPGMAGGDATNVESGVDKALRKHEMKVAGGRAGESVAPPASAARPALLPGAVPTASAAAPAARAGGLLGKAADLGSTLEVLKTLGVHVPAISAIPVIGPVLGAVLKARAAIGIVGRKGGSIGRSTESVIAAKAAAVQDRINAATQAILTGAAKGARKLSEVAAGPAVTLGYKLFPGGDEPKGKDPIALYHARMDEIARAQQPGAIEHAIGDRVQTSDPNLQAAIVTQVQRGIAFLDSKSPKPSMVQSMLPADGSWHPSKAQLEEWGRYVHAVGDPASVIEDLAKGHVSTEGAEVLRMVYPELFAIAQRALFEAAPRIQTTLPYTKRVALSVVYGVPIDGSLSSSHVQYLAAAPQPAQPGAGPQQPQGGPGLTGPLQIGRATMTALDQRGP